LFLNLPKPAFLNLLFLPKPPKLFPPLSTQLRKERADRDAADVARLVEVQKSLRNQSYGYSHSGELVILQNVDVERLPAAIIGPKVAIADGGKTSFKIRVVK
jgi:hypothetical protein